MKNLPAYITFILAFFIGSAIINNIKKTSSINSITADDICDYARKNMNLPIRLDEITTLREIKCVTTPNKVVAYYYELNETPLFSFKALSKSDIASWNLEMQYNLAQQYCYNDDVKILKNKNFTARHIYEFENNVFTDIILTPNICE